MSDDDEQAAHSALMNAVRAMGYGFIQMRGGYTGDQGFVEEKSLFIPSITKNETIQLGVDFDQHTVIHKSKEEFVMVATNTEDGIGKVLMNFARGGKSNLKTTQDAIKNYFSCLIKGSHRGKKFVFSVEERESWSFNLAAYTNRTPRWLPLMEWKEE
jgi:hypothetical protein